MPAFLENRLRAEARKRGYGGHRADAYVYGTMNNRGYMKGSRETARGRAVAIKHARDMRSRRRSRR